MITFTDNLLTFSLDKLASAMKVELDREILWSTANRLITQQPNHNYYSHLLNSIIAREAFYSQEDPEAWNLRYVNPFIIFMEKSYRQPNLFKLLMNMQDLGPYLCACRENLSSSVFELRPNGTVAARIYSSLEKVTPF